MLLLLWIRLVLGMVCGYWVVVVGYEIGDEVAHGELLWELELGLGAQLALQLAEELARYPAVRRRRRQVLAEREHCCSEQKGFGFEMLDSTGLIMYSGWR